ncbi:endonuclease MutS2 [Meiothermus ruber]|jgi:DNA mismatch repair protein MutS2|uniref:Endonuclease MutS2 n=1 Tax=Meiothermus ruber (strain ATCC 35948 / DSM 1279 / VKM B-1258 / 21) TaxID=504728 RepID=D3PQY5_MEIRD|nr:endonuclease MutS2 [Meiothermus ruber]ADD27868.1 MutS2 family protein [Meiothermus ruber DSM 1279]AGK04335.1 MutS2 family protein [Meiothermus ruber DSM 1279]MCL6530421.1 endonuclease MutS2 [Meiothermus ruber]GAO74803.1 MutS2 family protein [Meiothermus ruber H328]
MLEVTASLDFDRVRQALAERAATFIGREALLALQPKSTLEEAQRQQEIVAEALAYPYRLGGIVDLRPPLAAAREGLRLEGPQLREVAASLEAIVALKHELLEIGVHLKALAGRIGEHTYFLRRIRESLDEAGNVRDEATPRLREIRRRVNPVRERIQDRLYQLMDRHPEAIQERFVTLRRDRYVIPVKASHQNKLPGIVLDQSDSKLTVYLEPASVVPLNNELASLRLEEEAEVNRVLFELSAALANDPELEATLQALTELDMARAAASLAEDWGLVRPRLNRDGLYRLQAARHPLIANPVSNDITLTPHNRILLITGPNMGGKTALLKTLGLAVLMAQCGLYVAAEQAELAFPDRLFVDIGDQQSLQESLSTFAAHVLRLKEVLEAATPHSLALIDELGSGTDPEEGAALAQAFVEGLLAKGVRGLITTHLSPLKAFAQDTPGVQNASMRFDLERLRPTYQLVVGAPGRSYALSIARRLGFPREQLERAEALLGPEGGRLERLLAALEAERERLYTLHQKAQAQQQETARLQQELARQLAELAEHKERLIEEAKAQAEQIVKEAQERIRQTRERSKTQGQGQALQELIQLRSRYQRPEKAAPSNPGLQVGAIVEVPEYGGQATVVELRGQEAVLQMGAVRLTVPVARLQPQPAHQSKPSAGRVAHKAKIPTELNLRGLTVEEALLAVDDYLAEAKATATTPVRLLHGKGTGALRNALRESLKRDRRVESFHDAVPYEGGHGVTVVHLRI